MSIADNGALVASSGAKTGRTPKDKRVVEHPDSKNDIWWGAVNIPCDERTFQINRQSALDYLNTRDRLYCFDGFAGWDPKYRSVSGLVKLMGRHSGFVTAAATIANHDVNFALIPEVPFKLDVFLVSLKQRMLTKSHSVIAIAEGAGHCSPLMLARATLPAT